MLELNEIRFKTRKFTEDYIWFGKGGVDQSWMDSYKRIFFKTDNDIQIFAELEGDNYRLYFDKIVANNRIDKDNRTIYYVLIANGKRGSESSKLMYKIVQNYLCGKKENLSAIFDEVFSMDYITSVYDNAKKEEVGTEINQKLQEVAEKLESLESSFIENSIEENKYLFDNFDNGKELFLSEISKITSTDNLGEGITSLVLTQQPIKEERLVEFDYTKFAKGLCVSLNEMSSNLPLVKTIKEEPIPEPEIQVEPEIQEEQPETDSELSKKAEDEKASQQDNLVQEPMLAIKNKGGLVVFLIILVILIVVLVRSCGQKSQEPQNAQPQEPQNAQPQTEQTQK